MTKVDGRRIILSMCHISSFCYDWHVAYLHVKATTTGPTKSRPDAAQSRPGRSGLESM